MGMVAKTDGGPINPAAASVLNSANPEDIRLFNKFFEMLEQRNTGVLGDCLYDNGGADLFEMFSKNNDSYAIFKQESDLLSEQTSNGVTVATEIAKQLENGIQFFNPYFVGLGTGTAFNDKEAKLISAFSQGLSNGFLAVDISNGMAEKAEHEVSQFIAKTQHQTSLAKAHTLQADFFDASITEKLSAEFEKHQIIERGLTPVFMLFGNTGANISGTFPFNRPTQKLISCVEAFTKVAPTSALVMTLNSGDNAAQEQSGYGGAEFDAFISNPLKRLSRIIGIPNLREKFERAVEIDKSAVNFVYRSTEQQAIINPINGQIHRISRGTEYVHTVSSRYSEGEGRAVIEGAGGRIVHVHPTGKKGPTIYAATFQR